MSEPTPEELANYVHSLLFRRRSEPRCVRERCGHTASMHGGCFNYGCRADVCFCSGFLHELEVKSAKILDEPEEESTETRLGEYLFGKD